MIYRKGLILWQSKQSETHREREPSASGQTDGGKPGTRWAVIPEPGNRCKSPYMAVHRQRSERNCKPFLWTLTTVYIRNLLK